eukprot:1150577-Pelagomonas_calceolata.AAC.8
MKHRAVNSSDNQASLPVPTEQDHASSVTIHHASIEQHASSAAIHIDITDIKNLPWRDDGRTISRERALKVLFNMHE